MKKFSLIIIISLMIVICLILGTGIGAVFIPPSDVMSAILFRLFDIPLPDGFPESSVSIIMDIRMPRVILAFFTGAALSVSGAAIQSVLSNPLASPYTLGVSSGASVGAAFVILIGSVIFGNFTVAVGGLTAAIVTIFIVIAFSSKADKNLESTTVILTGMVTSLFLSAGVNLIANISDEKYKQILKWQTGTFAGRGWGYAVPMIIVSIICIFIFFCFSKELDLLTFGSEQAMASGVDAGKIKIILLLISAVLTGTAVAFSGVIGFIDMIAPQIVRRIFGARHKYVIPLSAAAGGCFMVICDLISRTITAPNELPVGTVTAVTGAPVFAYIFIKQRKVRG